MKAPQVSQVPEFSIIGVTGIPEVQTGDDLAVLIVDAASRQGTPLANGDILVVTQKVVSKAEGCVVDLREVAPSAFALTLAHQWDKDPRHVEVVLRESRRIVRMDRGIIIAETLHGYVCANAGVDASNVPGTEQVSLLPRNPDASARRVGKEIRTRAGVTVAVLVSDTFGRPWREGTTNVAIGVAGFRPLQDYRGQQDPYSYVLRVSVAAWADELTGAADLVLGKTRGVPVAIIRGLVYETGPDGSEGLLRSPEKDLFR